MFWKLRYWLIEKLAMGDAIVLNTTFNLKATHVITLPKTEDPDALITIKRGQHGMVTGNVFRN